MKLSWFDIIWVLLGLFIAYQLILVIFGGSSETEGLIIAFLVFNLGLTWKLTFNILKLNIKFERHISWHKAKEN